MTSLSVEAKQKIERVRNVALLAAVVGLVLCLIGAFINPEHRAQLFRSYLIAYVFCLSLGVGSLAILMLQYVTGGRWGFVLRRPLEVGTKTLPVLALLFLPLLLGLRSLYLWAQPDVVSHDPALQFKSMYLNVPFFLGRAAFYFVVWIVLAAFLNAWSRREDKNDEPSVRERFQALSAPGLILYTLTMTFASIDWAMSLEPHWFSTMYGVLFAFGQIVTAHCFVVALVILLGRVSPLRELVGPEQLADLGNLLLAFVMIWAYLAFSQFLLVWSGNLKEEVPWYIARMEGGWQVVAILLIVGHFVLPFVMLLSRDLKRNPQRLLVVVLIVLGMRFVDLYWLIAPAFSPAHFRVHWLDVASLLAVGGIWLGVFLWLLQRTPLVAEHDPRLREMNEHG